MVTQRRKTIQEMSDPKKPSLTGGAAIKRGSPNDDETLVEPQVDPTKDRPALTINIQSWATPIVGIIMLIIGALAGFYARPAVLGQLPESVSDTPPVVAIPTEDRSEAQQQLMASLLPKVRHFLGDPNAPIVLLEFGDFQ